MRTISLLGGTAGIVVAALVVAVIESRRTRSRSVVAFVATVVAGQFLVSNLVKWSVDRARPTIDQLTGFAGTSFPSGHATAAAATYAAFALLLGRGRSDAVKALLVGGAAADRGRRRGDPGVPRGALVHRRGRRPRRRMDVVRDLFDHVRWPLAALRGPGRIGRAGGDDRADAAALIRQRSSGGRRRPLRSSADVIPGGRRVGPRRVAARRSAAAVRRRDLRHDLGRDRPPVLDRGRHRRRLLPSRHVERPRPPLRTRPHRPSRPVHGERVLGQRWTATPCGRRRGPTFPPSVIRAIDPDAPFRLAFGSCRRSDPLDEEHFDEHRC